MPRALPTTRDLDPRGSTLSRLRSTVAGGLGLAGALFLVHRFGQSRPLRDWLFFDLARIWFWDLTLSAACAGLGLLAVERLVPAAERRGLGPIGALGLAFPLGLVGFVLGMYAGGFLHLYGPVFAVALPAALLAAGAGPTRRLLADTRAAASSTARRIRPLPLLASVLGLLAFGVLYLGVLSPDAINYDATWQHLVIAQDYAREGRIVPFPGDWDKNLPHLGSLVSAWAFMVPGLPLPALRWMMALHTELTVLVWTLVGVAAVARWIAERDTPGLWVAFFLFPGIFVYDGNLGGAGDHYLALFAAPLLLAAGRACRDFEPRACVLAGVLAGGASLTRAHAIYMIAPVAVALLASAVRHAWRRARGDRRAPALAGLARGLGLTAATALMVMAPHLIKNAVFFKNPMYPLLQRVFTASTPAFPDSAFLYEHINVDWGFVPPAALGERLLRAAELVFTFSFVPHYSFVNNLPVFGSLFTLSLPLLIVVQDARRLRWAALIGAGAVFSWAFTFWVDRNLQTFMPLLAAVTAAVLIRTWELGRLARVGVVLLVAGQAAWGLPLAFSGQDRMQGALTLLRSGMEGRARGQLLGYRQEFVALGASLPKDAVVLLHTAHPMLGIDRRVLLDLAGFQGIIDYRAFRTPRDMYDRLRALGVTHVVSLPGARDAPSKQEDVIFDVFAELYGGPKQRFGGLELFAMPSAPPPAEVPLEVVALGVRGYADGRYPVDKLSTCQLLPAAFQHFAAPEPAAAPGAAVLDGARVVIIGPNANVDAATSERLQRELRPIAAHTSFRVLLRQPP